MSWQNYIDSGLINTGQASAGAIVGVDGSVWATSPGFNISSTEIKALINGFTDISSLRTPGLFLNKEKYLVLKADDTTIYGKKGATGVVCAKISQVIIIGIYSEGMIAEQCNVVVKQLAKYLTECGY